MLNIRRISSSRWWHKKKIWIFLGIFLFLVFVRISKGSLYKDFFYFISSPFWPGQFQKEVIVKSIDQESLIKLNLLKKDSTVICEHSPNLFIKKSTLWETIDVRNYGQSRLTFLINVQHP